MVIGTVLPFSTRGGTSSFTLPAWMTSPPTTSRIAAARDSDVAFAGLAVKIGATLMIAVLPATARKRRRVESVLSLIISSLCRFAQGHEIGHDILDLLGRQDGFAAPCTADPLKSVDAIVGRHDRRGIEAGSVDEPKPDLAFRPAVADAGKARREITLRFRLRERAGVTENTGVLAVDDDRASSLRITGGSRQRRRIGIAAHDNAT